MNAARNKISGARLSFIVVVAVVAIGTYGSDSWRVKSAAREAVITKRSERNAPADAHALCPATMVRHFPGGAVDESSQWQMIRNLSGEEVKSAIGQLPKPDGMFDQYSWLREMLYYRWGELEPVAANTAAKAFYDANPPPKGWATSGFPHYRRAVLTAWIKQGHVREVWDAIKDDGEMWACTMSVPGEVAHMIVASLSNETDESAFRALLQVNDEHFLIVDTLCRARARMASKTPESRAAFLAATALYQEPWVIGCAYENLFREWADADVAAARAGALSMDMPKDLRKDVESVINRVAESKQRELEKAVHGGAGRSGEVSAIEEGVCANPDDGASDITSDNRNPDIEAWQQVKQRVFNRAEASPDLFVDYRLREEILDVMGGAPETDLENWFRELAPVQEIEIPCLLGEMMQQVLIQRGAERFICSLANHPPAGMDDAVTEAMDLWIRHDPAAVKAWLGRGDLPPSVMKRRDDYLEDAVDELDHGDETTNPTKGRHQK